MQPQPECVSCRSAPAILGKYSDAYCPDCEELVARAIRAIWKARQDGCLKQGYHPSSWREAKNRLSHAEIHIREYNEGSTSEDHLAHAICDLVMSYDRV